LAEFKPQAITGYDALHYPWYRHNAVDKWEYKLVKLQGYFKEERFFVRKARDGRAGYFVFAPFITAYLDYNPTKTTTVNYPVEKGIWVNLGWVPLENINDIERSTEPLPLMDPPGEEDSPFEDIFTGIVNFPENPLEEEVLQITEVTGIVRKGEKANWLIGNRNWPEAGNFNFIDLHYMSRLFRFSNYESASTAYIERTVETLEEGAESTYPIPATKDTFFKPYWKPSTHLTYSSLFGVMSLAGWVAMAVV